MCGESKSASVRIMSDEEVIEVTVDLNELKKLKVRRSDISSLRIALLNSGWSTHNRLAG